MEPQFCANILCVKNTEHRGGRFLYSVSEGKTFCEDCYGLHIIREPGKNLWDMVTTHGDGKPTQIKSLADMRAYEKKHGVSNHAANYDTRNW